MSEGVKLKELAELGLRTARSIVEREDSPDGNEASVVPVFLVINVTGDIGIIMTPWANDREKAATFAHMRELFAKEKIQAYAFVSECWTVKAEKGDDLTGIIPSESPDRIEVLMVDAHSLSGEGYTGFAEIKRKDDGSREVLPPTFEPAMVTEGRGANLLRYTGEQPN